MARVLLQMGHCFRKSGATGTSGIDANPTEQEFAHEACNTAAHMLAGYGHKATVIVADPADSEYRGYDAFVAVHCDGSTSGTARGASVGYRTAEGAHLGALFKQAYANGGWSGGFRPDNYTAALAGYYGVREAVQAGCRYSIIVESGFLTSPQDEALLTPPGGTDRVARAITNAVVGVYGGTTPPPPPLPQDWSSHMIAFTAHPDGSRVDLLGIGPDKRIWHWTAPDFAGLAVAEGYTIGDGRGESVTAMWAGGELVVFVVADGGRPFVSRWRGDVEGWTSWEHVPPGAVLLDAYSR